MKYLLIGTLIISSLSLSAQTTGLGNTYVGGAFLGWDFSNGVNPLTIRTNNTTRMYINGITAGYGVNTSGFIGLGTTNPASPLHIVGKEQQAAVGWRRGLALSNSAAITWDGAGGKGFIMAHPSSSPNGNFYAGILDDLNSSSAVNYAFTVHVNQQLSLNPLASTQIYKNLLVLENGGIERRFGVNVVDPARVSEIFDGGDAITDAQLRLSTANNSWTDFRTTSLGHMLITPNGNRVGITAGGTAITPTATLDVNGDARIRNVQTANPNSLLIGVNANGASDVNVRRLDFSGNAGEVLLGNGTWGTAPGTVTANNGITAAGNIVRLGAPCTAFFQLISSRFTESRAVYLNGNSFWMLSTADQSGGVGFGAQPASLGLCGVGNTVEISANNQSAYGNTDASGLRFTKLTSTSPIVANGTNGVDNTKLLTVDQNGDVVLTDVPSSSGNEFIDCADNTGAADLLVDSKLNLNNQNLFFEGAGAANENQVFIGSNCSTTSLAKLDVYTDAQFVGERITVERNGDMSGIGLYSTVNNVASGGLAYGVFSAVFDDVTISNVNNGPHVGVYGLSSGSYSQYQTGVMGRAMSTPNNTGSTVPVHFGGRFDASGEYAYGIYATASGTTFQRAGHFAGVISVGATIYTSDSTFKDNVSSIGNGLDITRKLQPKTYFMDTTNYSFMGFESKKQYGFIAQDVENVMPELVSTERFPGDIDSAGNVINAPFEYKSLNYNAIIPINTQAINELNQKVEKATLSDESIKTNVADLSGSLDKVLAMRGVSYDWNTSVNPSLGLDSLNHVGFIAQELQQIDTRLTYLDSDSLMHVEYDKVVPILAEAIEELHTTVESQDSIIGALQDENQIQQSEINDLNDRLTNLENCLSGILPLLCQLNNSAIAPTQEEVQQELAKAIDVELSDKNNIILNQNVPNPFAEKTVISYSIPATVGKAQIHFYDGKGNLINTVEITERGSGEINVYANDLSTGVYTYSLVADGQIVATKRMMKH